MTDSVLSSNPAELGGAIDADTTGVHTIEDSIRAATTSPSISERSAHRASCGSRGLVDRGQQSAAGWSPRRPGANSLVARRTAPSPATGSARTPRSAGSRRGRGDDRRTRRSPATSAGSSAASSSARPRPSPSARSPTTARRRLGGLRGRRHRRRVPDDGDPGRRDPVGQPARAVSTRTAGRSVDRDRGPEPQPRERRHLRAEPAAGSLVNTAGRPGAARLERRADADPGPLPGEPGAGRGPPGLRARGRPARRRRDRGHPRPATSAPSRGRCRARRRRRSAADPVPIVCGRPAQALGASGCLKKCGKKQKRARTGDA